MERKTKTLDDVINDVMIEKNNTFLKHDIENLKKYFRAKWRKSKNEEYFLRTSAKWLNDEILYSRDNNESKPSTSGKPNRPTKAFKDCSEKSKKRKVEHILDAPIDELLFAIKLKLKKSGKTAASSIISKIEESSNNDHKCFLEKIETTFTPITPTQALTHIINLNIGREGYEYLRTDLINSNNGVAYPPYNLVLNEKKKCYPNNIFVDEYKASIPLQDLVDHTSIRLIENLKDLVNFSSSNGPKKKLVMLYKYGFDGSGCHSIYNLKSDEKEDGIHESNMFTSFICPIYLKDLENNKLIWYNPAPSSPIYCRPYRMTHKMENQELIQKEHEEILTEIRNLEISLIFNTMEVESKFILTMIDGKVFNHLNENKSSASCIICVPKTTPKHMNKIEDIMKKSVSRKALSYGISPLHLLINSLEFILHLSYRLPLKKWAIKGTAGKKNLK